MGTAKRSRFSSRAGGRTRRTTTRTSNKRTGRTCASWWDDRYDSRAALEALNTLYADLRLWQNLWLPSVKLVKKTRVGSRLRRE